MSILDGIPFLPSPNQHAGRSLVTPGVTAKITDIVLHWMDGTLASTDATFAGSAREVSAHFGIEGVRIHRYVADADTAWHAGDWNENQRSIGIEHSAQPGRAASPDTIATSVALIVALCRKYAISPDHIYPHKKFYATACPGTLPIAAIIAAVRAQLTTPPATPEIDMPLTDAEMQKIADLTVHSLLIANLGRTGPNVAVALQTASNFGVASIAAAVVAALPAGGTNVTAAQIAKAVNDDAAARLAA